MEGNIAALESGTLARINVSGRHLSQTDCKILTSILGRPAVASRLAILDLRWKGPPCVHQSSPYFDLGRLAPTDEATGAVAVLRGLGCRAPANWWRRCRTSPTSKNSD